MHILSKLEYLIDFEPNTLDLLDYSGVVNGGGGDGGNGGGVGAR
jgi:hypothetical protein